MSNPYGSALFVLQKISCFLSATGSSMIISQVSRNPYNRSKPQQRLILGLSVSDLCTSVIWILTPLLMPSGTWGSPWAIGNQTTCNLQGFIVTLFNASAILYMCALQSQYLLTIKYGWSENRIRRKAEPYMHLFPWCLGLAAAIAQLALKLFNPADWDCWIAPYPADCTSSHELKNSDLTETDCVRGDNAEIYRWSFFFAPLWVAIVFCITAMIMIFRSVREKERRSLRYSTRVSRGEKKAERSMLVRTEKVKAQCFMYAGAFFVVWTFPTIARLIQLLGGTIHPVIGVLAGTFIGIQGFLNAIIYFRPRYHMMALETPSKLKRVWVLVCSCLFFCCHAETITKGSKYNSDYMPPPARSSQMSDGSCTTSRRPDVSISEAEFKSKGDTAPLNEDADDDLERGHPEHKPNMEEATSDSFDDDDANGNKHVSFQDKERQKEESET